MIVSYNTGLRTILRVFRRQPQLGALPDSTIPGFDLQGTGGIERILGDTGLHRETTDDPVDGRSGWSMPADAANAYEGIRFRDIIDQCGVGAVGIARFLENRHGPYAHMLTGFDGLHEVNRVVAARPSHLGRFQGGRRTTQ